MTQPELPEPVPDPVTDDEAYRALRRQAETLNSAVLAVERERRTATLAREEAARQAVITQLAEDLAARYPTPIPFEVFTLAETVAYRDDGDDADPLAITEYYGLIVAVINAALAAKR